MVICPKCGDSGAIRIDNDWSAWGLHKVGLSDTCVLAEIRCQKCGYTVRKVSGKGEADRAVKQAENAFSEGAERTGETLSWSEAFKRCPAIKDDLIRRKGKAGLKTMFGDDFETLFPELI